MQRVNGVGMALLAILTGAVTILLASLLPFFMGEVWGPLWGVEWWPAGTVRSFGHVGPAAGVSPWAALLAVPIVATLLLVGLVTLVGILVLSWRGGLARAR
jgi:hypothetical protein